MNPINLITQRKKRINQDILDWHLLGSNNSSSVGRICNIIRTSDFENTDDMLVSMYSIYDGYYNGSIYIIAGRVVSGSNIVLISSNGVAWRPATTTPAMEWLFKIGWNGTYWLVAGIISTGVYGISYSMDGDTWSTPTVISGYPVQLTNNSTHWYMSISQLTTEDIAKIPFDTSDWANISYINAGLDTNVGPLAMSNSHAIIGSSSIFDGKPALIYSTNLTTWNTATYPAQYLAVDSMCRHGSLWFATVHTDNPVAYALLKSTDGINFTEVTVDAGNTLRVMLIHSDGSTLVIRTAIILAKYIVYTSINAGVTWIKHDFEYRPTYASIYGCMSRKNLDDIPPII